MGQRNNRERRVSKEKYYGVERRKPTSTILRYFKGYRRMCRKASICPEFERRTQQGINSACEHCEYIKKERKALMRLRLTLLATFLIFICTTYFRYNS